MNETEYNTFMILLITITCTSTFLISIIVSFILKKKRHKTITDCILNSIMSTGISAFIVGLLLLNITPGVMSSYNDKVFDDTAVQLTNKYAYVITSDDVRNIYTANGEKYSFTAKETFSDKTNIITGWMEDGAINISYPLTISITYEHK